MHGLTDGRCLHQPRQTQNKRTHTKRRPPLSGLAWHCPQRVVIGCGQLIVIQKKEGEAQRKSCRQTSSAESAPSLSITSPQSLYPFSSHFSFRSWPLFATFSIHIHYYTPINSISTFIIHTMGKKKTKTARQRQNKTASKLANSFAKKLGVSVESQRIGKQLQVLPDNNKKKTVHKKKKSTKTIHWERRTHKTSKKDVADDEDFVREHASVPGPGHWRVRRLCP